MLSNDIFRKLCFSIGCGSPQWANDQWCDDENNNAGCNFDGGACCNNDFPGWDNYCNTCACLENGGTPEPPAPTPAPEPPAPEPPAPGPAPAPTSCGQYTFHQVIHTPKHHDQTRFLGVIKRLLS